jgi:hypothetical protein
MQDSHRVRERKKIPTKLYTADFELEMNTCTPEMADAHLSAQVYCFTAIHTAMYVV